MTFPTPILITAFTLVGAALLALRFAALTATRRSTVKVRSNQHRPAGSRSKTNG